MPGTWSGIRKKSEQTYLCPSLKGRIQYFATSYSKCPDHEGRAAIRLDGKEVLKSNYYECCLKEYLVEKNIINKHHDLSSPEKWQKIHEETLKEGNFDQRDFYSAFQEFDNQSIEKSIESSNAIVCLMAILDYRLGIGSSLHVSITSSVKNSLLSISSIKKYGFAPLYGGCSIGFGINFSPTEVTFTKN